MGSKCILIFTATISMVLFAKFVPAAAEEKPELKPPWQTKGKLKVTIDKVAKEIDFEKNAHKGDAPEAFVVWLTIEHIHKKRLSMFYHYPRGDAEYINLNSENCQVMGKFNRTYHLIGVAERADVQPEKRQPWVRCVVLRFEPIEDPEVRSVDLRLAFKVYEDVKLWTLRFENVKLTDKELIQDVGGWKFKLEKIEERPLPEKITSHGPTKPELKKCFSVWFSADAIITDLDDLTFGPFHPLTITDHAMGAISQIGGAAGGSESIRNPETGNFSTHAWERYDFCTGNPKPSSLSMSMNGLKRGKTGNLVFEFKSLKLPR